MISVEISYDLETSSERDDLTFEMFADDSMIDREEQKREESV